MSKVNTRINYYLSGVAGFVISFGAIVTPAAYYLQSVQADAIRPTLPQLTANYLRKAARAVTTPKSNLDSITTNVATNTLPTKSANADINEVIPETARSIDPVTGNLASNPLAINSTPLTTSVTTTSKLLTQPLPTTSETKQKPYHQQDIVAESAPEYREQRLVKKFQVGRIVRVEATAYCLNGTTASGIKNKYGIVAADPKVLPIGSIVRVYDENYSGIYTVMDTGCLIKGRKIDIYLQNSREAVRFGRRKIALEILRYGWDPQATSFPSANPNFTGEPNISPDKAKTAGPQINAQAVDR
jgi:3D (Asp-Asp-Asp) domain-containing protein